MSNITRQRDRARKERLSDTRAVNLPRSLARPQRRPPQSDSQFLEAILSESESESDEDGAFVEGRLDFEGHRAKRRRVSNSIQPSSLDNAGSELAEPPQPIMTALPSTPVRKSPSIESRNEMPLLLESPVCASRPPTVELLSPMVHATESPPLQHRSRPSPASMRKDSSSEHESLSSDDDAYKGEGSVPLGVELPMEGLGMDSDDDERPWFLAPSDDEREPRSPSEESSQGAVRDDEDNPAASIDGDGAITDNPNPEYDPSPSPPPSGPLIIAPHKDPVSVYLASHHMWFVRITLVVIVLLHFSYHLPFAACDLALFLSYLIFKGLKIVSKKDQVPITLTTAIRRLDLRDRFKILPVCPAPSCQHVFLGDLQRVIDNEHRCTECDELVFEPTSDTLVEEVLGLFMGRKEKSKKPPVPKLVVAYRPISELVAEFLSRDGMVEKMDEWRHKPRADDVLGDIMDGRIWKELKGADDRPFFGEHCPEELRIGITVNLDWCNLRRSALSSTHSTGPISVNIANLNDEERYLTKNLLLPMVLPGPNEPKARPLQEYLIILVDDLLTLWESGMKISVTDRLVRVAVAVVICDHPALCKFFVYGEKNHTHSPCHRCDVETDDIKSDEALTDQYLMKNFDDQKRLALENQSLESEKERDNHFKAHGVGWHAFLRLPYFNPIRMAVLDPMHNLLLGIVRRQWYHAWILPHNRAALREDTATKRRELHDVHSLLKTAEFPSWLGRVPKKIGQPAGGSLSADEWKTLVLVFGPLALPIVWEDWIDTATEEHHKKQETYAKNAEKLKKAHNRAVKKWETGADEYEGLWGAWRYIRKKQAAKIQIPGITRKYTKAEEPKEPPPRPSTPDPGSPPTPRMHADEMENFLRLSAALTLLLGRTVRKSDLPRAQELLYDYLVTFSKFYPGIVVASHHYAAHIIDQIYDYATVYSFWAFLQERLNFIIKSFKTNNHTGGIMEVTMMRSYSASSSLRQMLLAVSRFALSAKSNIDEVERGVLQAITARVLADPIARGTLEVTAGTSKLAIPHESLLRQELLPLKLEVSLMKYINNHPKYDGLQVYLQSDATAPPNHPCLSSFIKVIDHAFLDGRRIVPMDNMRGKIRPTIIQTIWNFRQGGTAIVVGELLKLFLPCQEPLSTDPIAFIRWLKPARRHPLDVDVWAKYKDVLTIGIWEFGVYDDSAHDDDQARRPPNLIPFSSIRSQAARITVRRSKGEEGEVWLTIGLDKHGTRT